MCPRVTLGGDELPRGVAGDLRGLWVASGVTSSCGGNGWPCEIARCLSGLVGSWVAMKGFPWPLGVTVDLCQRFTNALNFKIKLVTHR
jgi:hypothetical protein